MPAGIERTVAQLERPTLGRAALALIELLLAAWPRAEVAVGATVVRAPTPLAARVRDQLRSLSGG